MSFYQHVLMSQLEDTWATVQRCAVAQAIGVGA